jgi:hypothetical protein
VAELCRCGEHWLCWPVSTVLLVASFFRVEPGLACCVKGGLAGWGVGAWNTAAGMLFRRQGLQQSLAGFLKRKPCGTFLPTASFIMDCFLFFVQACCAWLASVGGFYLVQLVSPEYPVLGMASCRRAGRVILAHLDTYALACLGLPWLCVQCGDLGGDQSSNIESLRCQLWRLDECLLQPDIGQ